MKGKLAVVVVALGLGAAGEYWALKRRAEQVCLTARDLASHASVVSRWVGEAAADPFLGPGALRGPTNSVLALYRDKSRWIVSEFSLRLLPPEVKQSFQALSVAQPGTQGMAEALKTLPSSLSSLKCESRLPASAQEEELTKMVDTGNLFWSERRAVAVMEKQEFARDKVIFCKAEDLLKNLRKVLEAAANACQSAPPGSKLAKTCSNGRETASLEGEVQDLEKQKEFNLRKLRQKWPEGVLQGLSC